MIVCYFALKADLLDVISVALPKVALSSPPNVSLVCSATCSVASPSRPASGRMARQAMPKTVAGAHSRCSERKASGTKASSKYSLLLANMCLEPSRNEGIGLAIRRGSRPGEAPLVDLWFTILALGHGMIEENRGGVSR